MREMGHLYPGVEFQLIENSRERLLTKKKPVTYRGET